uniref:Uncharacterized protein n=1 Tax=Bos indicus x Bos taurus TaxID=30522 RepID=A0A4W2CJ76_BOBOX
MYKTKVLFLQHHFQDCILEHLFPFPHATPLVFNLATSFFPYLVCVELDNSLGFGRKISLNTQWKLKRRIFSSGLPISSGVFFNEKIKEIVCDPLITPSI